MSTQNNLQPSYVIFKPQRNEKETDQNAVNRQDSDYECVSCFDDFMFPPHTKLTVVELKKFNRIAIFVCVCTLIFATLLTGLSYFTFSDSKSCSVFAFAFDALLQAVSSVLLIWRFSSTTTNLGRKETIATLGVATSNFVSAIMILVPTIGLLIKKERPTRSNYSLIASSLGFVAYTVLFLAKYKLSRKLGSSSLMTDAVDSLGGAMMGLVILISSMVMIFTLRAWFIDSVISIGIAFFMLLYAATVMVEQVRRREVRETELTNSTDTKS